MKMLLAFALSMFVFLPARAGERMCDKYRNNALSTYAIKVVAANLKYGFEELCNHPRLADIYVDRRNLPHPQDPMRSVPHVWVTLHYFEYSCQYFMREADGVVTRKNCYNTW